MTKIASILTACVFRGATSVMAADGPGPDRNLGLLGGTVLSDTTTASSAGAIWIPLRLIVGLAAVVAN